MSSENLIEEIKQIASQYHAEVGRDRKAWPNSIKTRVASLFEQGLKAATISRRTGIAYHTVLKWCPRARRGAPRGKSVTVSKGFKELSISPAQKLRAVTVATSKASFAEPTNDTAMVTVTTPKGFRIEVQNLEFALRLIESLEVG